MPPSRAYDALTVLCTAVDVLRRAALINVERSLPSAVYETRPKRQTTRPAAIEKSGTGSVTSNESLAKAADFVIPPNTWSYAQPLDEKPTRNAHPSPTKNTSPSPSGDAPPIPARDTLSAPNTLPTNPYSTTLDNKPIQALNVSLSEPERTLLPPETSVPLHDFDYTADAESVVKLTPSRVPSSRLGRLFHYGSLAASLTAGTASEYVRRAATGSGANAGSPMMSEANVARLVDKLSRMRGAALKLGQFLSIQDAHVLPEQIERVLRQVQNNAHYMPNSQLEKLLVAELGSDWQTKFDHFDPIPIASASIGQVHKATVSPSILTPTPSHPVPIALKVQFPNIAASISSDLANISTLLNASALLPRGLYLDRTLAVMRGELADECDYEREAAAMEKFGEFLGRKQERFRIPKVIRELTTKRVLAMEWMEGISIAKGAKWPKRIRDQISRDIMTLCLRELFEFRFMQTDPNWSNFLYNPKTDQLELIDFGASREYSKEFMDNWYMLLSAAVAEDREACVEYSLKLGYLTGKENEEMIAAHVRSLTLLGIPFRSSTNQPFAFASQTITDEIRSLIPVMLRHRLTPPPQETYSLNRKLSGAFLLCGRLGADVDCRAIWEQVVGSYRVGM
ncbi:ABC1-domain-containing protein [Ceratobasidium sp. AG-I]|nr:ABC1-domain-containing protein [Ceratobasidium sp. AG-I]